MGRGVGTGGGCACCVCQERAELCRFCAAGSGRASRYLCRADYCAGAGSGQALWGLTARGRAGERLQGSLLGLGWYPPEPGFAGSGPRRLLEIPVWKLPLGGPG